MNAVTKRFAKPELADDLEAMTLEELLGRLERFGDPKLSRLAGCGKWWARINLHINSVGGNFQVESELLDTPKAAALQCAQRVRQTIAELGRGGAP